MDLEAEVRRLSAIEEIKALKARYFRAVDGKDWDLFRSCFSAGASFDFTDSTYETGRAFDDVDEFVAWVAVVFDGARTVHHGHMPEIEILSETSARAIWAMYDIVDQPRAEPLRRAGLIDGPAAEPLPAVQGYGHYHEEYERVGDRWLIAKLKLTRLRTDPYLEGTASGS